MQIKFQVMAEEGFDAECMPLEISPPQANILDYDIKFNNQSMEITEVINKEYGKIQFSALLIDQEASYVLGSKITVYTTIYRPNMLNIVHVHLNDMSDEATV